MIDLTIDIRARLDADDTFDIDAPPGMYDRPGVEMRVREVRWEPGAPTVLAWAARVYSDGDRTEKNGKPIRLAFDALPPSLAAPSRSRTVRRETASQAAVRVLPIPS